MFGKVQETPQTETTPFYPRSPYGAAKVYAYWITVNYREAYGMYACNGILFNHESPIRGETFVTRKITRGLARINEGLQDCLYLGNLDAMRDWGHARDYVEAQWLMLQQDEPEDFVIATGEQHSVREFVDSRRCPARDMPSSGAVTESTRRGSTRVQARRSCASTRAISARPKSTRCWATPSKARAKLGWKPEIRFDELVREMVEADLEACQARCAGRTRGFPDAASIMNERRSHLRRRPSRPGGSAHRAAA